MNDWYRRKTWTQKDEEEFFAKLGRARKDGRSQYLKIQAIELIETKDKKLLEVAELLLNKMLTEYPDDKLNIGPALQALGDIYKLKEDLDSAISYYKRAIDFEAVFPNVQTQAYLNYSELIVKTERTEVYKAIEKVLEEKTTGLLFPVEKYKVFSLLAVINKHFGKTEKVKYYENLVEQNANSETSGLRYHKYLGVVKERDSWLDRLIKKMI